MRGDYRAFHDVTFHGDEVALACLGEGSTSQGEFWEAINTASNQKLPVIFCVEDNGYAISVPVEVNTPGGNISRLVANFPNFYFAEIDGTDAGGMPARIPGRGRALPRGPGPGFRPWSLSCAPIRTRFPTTTSCIARLRSARRTPCAIRWPACRCACCAKEFSAPKRSTRWRSRSITKPPRPRTARSKLRFLRSRDHETRLLRGS